MPKFLRVLLLAGVAFVASLVLRADRADSRGPDDYWKGYWGWYDNGYRPYYYGRHYSAYRHADDDDDGYRHDDDDDDGYRYRQYAPYRYRTYRASPQYYYHNHGPAYGYRQYPYGGGSWRWR
jgi:hypothetical protein